jgi:hypothetical protein
MDADNCISVFISFRFSQQGFDLVQQTKEFLLNDVPDNLKIAAGDASPLWFSPDREKKSEPTHAGCYEPMDFQNTLLSTRRWNCAIHVKNPLLTTQFAPAGKVKSVGTGHPEHSTWRDAANRSRRTAAPIMKSDRFPQPHRLDEPPFPRVAGKEDRLALRRFPIREPIGFRRCCACGHEEAEPKWCGFPTEHES